MVPEPTATSASAFGAGVPQARGGDRIGMRLSGKNHRHEGYRTRERALDPFAQHLAGGRVADDRDALPQPQRRKEIGLPAGKAVLDRHDLNRNP